MQNPEKLVQIPDHNGLHILIMEQLNKINKNEGIMILSFLS